MIKIVIGDIFKSKAQTLVNTVNCVGIMGKGLSLAFKEKYPDMFKDYVKRCERGEITLGKPFLYKTLIPPWILLFPTKQDWRSVSRLVDIENGLHFLEKNYKEWGITSIAVPPLGCGLGELEWSIVGRTLYRYLAKLDIPVELYAPHGTPNGEATPEFLSEPSEAQLIEANKRPESRIESGFIPIVEVLRRLESTPYHWPVGRTIFQKIAYFGTVLGLKTNLLYNQSSFGPFSTQLKTKLTKLVNNGLISESKQGNMFMIKAGPTYKDVGKTYKEELDRSEKIIEQLTDLFCRLNTHEAEIAATVHFAYRTVKSKSDLIPTEKEVLNEVMRWKRKHRPPYDVIEIAQAIRNLAMHGWIDVEASKEVPNEVEVALEV
jgi:uncharacterized protein YwgA/O-acetyl-ADP-ribose deacetylase (regulator of RNase III)